MIPVNQKTKSRGQTDVSKIRSYEDIVAYLDANWAPITDLQAITQIDQALGNIAHTLPAILISGNNGKSLTAHFVVKLLKEEGLQVGAFFAPHYQYYNERFKINDETISNKEFTALANEIITLCETKKIQASTKDILTGIFLLHCKNESVDVVIAENETAKYLDSVLILQPKINAITRIGNEITKQDDANESIKNIMHYVQKGTHFVSADQNKLNLALMHTLAEEKNCVWSMPIRKPAPLAYPFEQLHGRCGALAERISQIYIQNFIDEESLAINKSLLSKPKGQRGRPTLEAKRNLELHPRRTLEQFWKSITSTLPARFELLEKEHPHVLVDNATNLDAFENLFLGIRLLHYQKPLKGLVLIFACKKESFNEDEFLKLTRYFFKKTAGSIIFCPTQTDSWDVEDITNKAKNLKIKARACASFKEAFETATKSVDEKHGLMVIAGSDDIVKQYAQRKNS
ncbi:hypothetical protein EBR77_01750 [bacterium]|nr:hypothetical protein [bacterium]